MSNFLDDLTSLQTNGFSLTGLANSSIGQSLGNSITASINKKLTPKPAAQPVPTVVTSSEVSVSNPDGMKKILMIAGGVLSLLVVVFLIKKGRK